MDQISETQRPPHRELYMGDGAEGKRYRQFQKYEIDGIFASEGWKKLTIEEAEKAVAEGRRVYGVYDPSFESFGAKSTSSTAARIVTGYDGKKDKPSGHKDFRSIEFYLDETETASS